jgi:hypothetical protein
VHALIKLMSGVSEVILMHCASIGRSLFWSNVSVVGSISMRNAVEKRMAKAPHSVYMLEGLVHSCCCWTAMCWVSWVWN